MKIKKKELILTFSEWLLLVGLNYEIVNGEIKVYPFRRNITK